MSILAWIGAYLLSGYIFTCIDAWVEPFNWKAHHRDNVELFFLCLMLWPALLLVAMLAVLSKTPGRIAELKRTRVKSIASKETELTLLEREVDQLLENR